ncbi:MAG TPA: hypothetical protein VFS56_12395, partial [Gemmatimonadaceae bacterium]|nr:hypothetical protein [Gemmatimonadaceae bacterium]
MVSMSARASFVCIAVFALNLGAQGSPYVPLDDIAYRYVDAMMARGEFRNLSALERPYTVSDLLLAIDNARGAATSARIFGYLDALETVVAKYSPRPRPRVVRQPVGLPDTSKYLIVHTARGQGCGFTAGVCDSQLPPDSMRTREKTPHDSTAHRAESSQSNPFRARATVNFYGTAQTSSRRELMRATDARSFSPAATIRIMIAGGPIAASIRPLIDTGLNEDIEFAGRRDRTLAARTEDGYVTGQWKYAELFFGRAARNWGPPALYGLQLGNYAYTYDHLYARIGTDKFHFATVITRLEDYRDAAAVATQRYFSIHRLALRHGAWEIAATESYLYSGVGRTFEPSLANPFNVYSLSWRNESQEGNLGLGLETSFRSRNGTLAAHVFLDDLQIDRCEEICSEPSSYGLTLSAEGLPLSGDLRWFASYARVSYLTYRTPNPSERYAAFQIGLGQGFSDFDEVRIGLDLAVVPRTPLRAYIAHRRQGEGDYRDPFPPSTEYATTPGIFGGRVSGITRFGISGASRWHDFELSGDVGVNRV